AARDALHRLALNLIENSLKHTPPGTQINVLTRSRGDEVTLVVEDNGPGVPPELAPTLFERFVRGAGDRGGSFGLGLAIVKAVAESHGGSVELEPSDDGRGARFVVRLPAPERAEVGVGGAANAGSNEAGSEAGDDARPRPHGAREAAVRGS